jgi:hypothetical protein
LIEAIKSKQFGDTVVNESFKLDLLKEIDSFKEDDSSLSKSFLEQMKKDIESFELSYNELVGLKNNLCLYKCLTKSNKIDSLFR